MSSLQRAELLQAEQALLPYIVSAEAQIVKKATLEAYFQMIPSKHAAFVAFFVLLALTVISLAILFFSHMWALLLVPLTTFLLMLGYVFRLHVIYQPQKSYYDAMQFLLVISPLLLAAALYSVLGSTLSGPQAALIPIVFVVADAVCLLIQTIGVRGLVSSDQTQIANGLVWLIVGMGLAVLVNVLFLIAALAYANTMFATVAPILVTILIFSAVLLLVRNVYRLQEFVYERIYFKDDQTDTKNEKLFYALDFAPIAVIVVLLCVFQLI